MPLGMITDPACNTYFAHLDCNPHQAVRDIACRASSIRQVDPVGSGVMSVLDPR